MRKFELGLLVVVIAVFMAYNRPTPAPPAAVAPTSSPAALPSPVESAAQKCPYALGAAHLFIEPNSLFQLHPDWRLTTEQGAVMTYQLKHPTSEQVALAVSGRVLALSIRGKDSEFPLTKDGLPAPGLGATRAEVLESLPGQPLPPSLSTSVQTSGANWTVLWHFDKDGIVDSIHLNGSMPGYGHSSPRVHPDTACVKRSRSSER